ncbi:MAG: hypothetical protein RIT02_364 [Planctomycetota bacterium]
MCQSRVSVMGGMMSLGRREFLGAAALPLLGARAAARGAGGHAERAELPVAALITAYYPVSHADVIVSKILEGYLRNGGEPRPGLKLVSMYVEQRHPHDISGELAKRYGVRVCGSIDEAISLGTDRVQVAGVLGIAEHGDYPVTEFTGQKMYPRRRFFDEAVATFERCGGVVPYFNDKHLGWRWSDAEAMVGTARRLGFPLLAGSSVPLAWRFPQLELPADCEIESALTVGYGPLEDYGFHALEAHQCMLERRRGGESGVREVAVALGAGIRAAEASGQWSGELFGAAMSVLPRGSVAAAAWDPLQAEYEGVRNQPAAYMMTHADGLRSAVIMTADFSGGFAFACRLKGRKEPLACWFRLQEGGVFGHFSYLVDAIEATLRARRAVYPVERTLLTTGVLDRCMQLLAAGGGRVATPELTFGYAGGDWVFANHPQSRLQVPYE